MVVANFPGLNYQELVRYSNRLQVTGLTAEDTDKILLGIGQTIVSLGGTADTAALATEQLIQAFQLGKVDLRDFRTIIQQIPGFYRALGDVHGVSENIDGLREGFEATGNNMRDLVIPIFDRLNETMESPPADSYVRVMDELQNSAFLTSAAIGDLLLPVVLSAASGLTNFFESIREGIKDVNLLPEPIQAIVEGVRELYDGLLNIAGAIERSVGPELNELIPALATLLGGVLELAGAIANALAPAYELLSKTTAVVVALITKLAQDVTSLIGVLTDFVDWVASAWQEEDKFTESTNRVTEAIENVEEATKKATTSTQDYQNSLRTILEELNSVNSELETKKTRLDELKSQGLEPTDASLAQIVRRIALLEERSKSLTASLPDLNQALEGVNEQLTEKQARLAEMAKRGDDASASAEQLQRQIANLTALAALLTTQIAQTTTELTETAPAAKTAAEATENYSLELAKLRARAEDVRENLSNVVDINTVTSAYQESIEASNAYYDKLLSNLREQLSAEEAGSERYNKIQTEIFETERAREQASRELLDEAAEYEASVLDRRTASRIQSAERAREAEVEGFESAAKSGQSYANQLRELRSVSMRRNFVELVNTLQEQGLSFDEARQQAQKFFDEINEIPPVLKGADAAYGNFASTLVRESDRSADAVANLLRGVQALGAEIGSLTGDQTFRLDSSLERSLLNEQRYFQQNPTGRTLDDIRQEAGQQGRQYVGRLFGRQDREAAEAQREAIQIYNDLSAATVDFTFSLIDLQGETNSADRAFQDLSGTFGRLATGDFTALLDIPIQLLNISRQTAAERQQGAQDRASLYEEQFGDFSRFGRNLSTVSGVLGIPESPELRDSFFFDQAGEFENVIAQSTTDFSDGIKNALLSSVINLERELTSADINRVIANFHAPIISSLENLAEQAAFNLDFASQSGGDVQGALQDVIDANTALTQTQVDSYNEQRRATGTAVGNVEELNRALNALNNQSRLQLDALPPNLFTIASGRRAAQATAERTGTDRQATEDVARAQYGDAVYDAEFARTDDETLAAALQANQESIAAINTAIAGLDASISQSNDPAEIEQLLQQIAIQIPERYRLRREALQQQLDAGDITQAAFDTSLAQLGIEESAELERNSDAMLANALLINRQAIEAINVQVAGLENAISQSNDPAEIINLLQQIATQIPEIYRLRRDALSEQFVAGEITLQAFNTSIAQLNIEQSAAVEQNSDQQLANTLLINQQTTEAVSSAISGLESRISQSSDPAEIARLLMEIAEQIPEIYRLRRNALSAQYAAGEITLQAINTGMANLNIEQAAAVERNADAQLANALVINQQSIDMLSAGVSSLENAIAESNDLTEIEVLLMDIAVQIPEIYQLRRDALQAQYDAGEITLSVLNTGLAVIDTEQAAALEQNSDAQLANALRMNQEAVESLNVGVSALENSIAQSSDPTEIATLLQQIAQQIPEIYQLRREALQSQYDAGEITLTALNTGIASLNIEASAALEQNSDAQLANALLINQQAVEAINAEISGIENAISQSNDPAEIANLLQQIAVQIPEIYQLRRETLQSQYDEGEITLSALQTGLAALGIKESAAVERNSDAMLANALSMNQLAAEAINTHIAGLEERISSSNDPVEIATLLQQVAQQIPEIYRLRRAALQRQFNEGEITLSALQTGLAQANIDESAALERNSDQQLANTLGVLNTDAQIVNTEINSLSEQIRNSNDPAEIVSLVVDLQTAVMEKYRLQREVLQKQLDAEELTIEAFNAELGSINLAETSELTSAAALGGAETDDLRRTSNALLQNALQRAQFRLTGATDEQGFETRRTELIRFINDFYNAEDERINDLMLSENELRDLREDNQLAREQALRSATDAENRFEEERLDKLKDVQDEIEDIRDEQIENEADRLESLQDLAEEHQDRLTDIEEDGIRRREDLNRDSQRTLEDLRREFQEDQEAVAVRFDRGEISREAAERQIGDLTREFIQAQGGLQRRQDRRLEDQGIQETRQREDAGVRFTESQADINAQAQAQAQALQEQLTPLLETQTTLVTQQQETAEAESITAVMASETAQVESETAAMAAATAQMESVTGLLASETAALFHESTLLQRDVIDIFESAATAHLEAGDILSEAGHLLIEGAQAAGLHEAAAALQTVASNFHVLFTGNVASVQRLPSPVPQPNFSPSVQGNHASSGGSPGPPPQPPQQLRARFQLMFPDGVVRDLQEQIVTLEAEDRV